MQKQIEQLIAFQKAFKSLVNTQPTLLTEEQWNLRLALSQEELDEYKEGCENEDIVEIFDSILDRLFLAFGDAVSHGLQDYLVAGFEEVLASNMSKLDDNGQPIINGENGYLDTSRPLGKILKSEKFFHPRLDLILANKK
jgi:predicted HAD superfamily Cof-like phosphohydrolase